MSDVSLIAWAALAGLAIALVSVVVRLLVGPTLHDRVLAANGIVINCALIAAALAVISAQSQWIDVAFALLFAVIVANVAIVKFFRVHSFQPPLGGARELSP